MTIYVGRWDLLPKEWEGFNGLSEKNKDEIRAEISREVDVMQSDDSMEDDSFVAVYEPEEFEATFNQTLTNHICSNIYWIRIFGE